MKVGFLGIGNMGGAIFKGYSTTAKTNGDDLVVFDLDQNKLNEATSEYGAEKTDSIEALVEKADVIFLGVKPNMFDKILPDVAKTYKDNKVIVSMAAGIEIRVVENQLGKSANVVRIMPNTAAQVGEAMIAVCKNDNVGSEIFEKILNIFKAIGKAEVVPESLIHCVIGVSGSSPAYTYMYIDALVKAAQKNGMSYEQAKIFAAQSVLGAAKMVLETGETPEQLRINVCSPGGTTIEAVNTLFDNGFEGNIIDGFQAAVDKSKDMTK